MTDSEESSSSECEFSDQHHNHGNNLPEPEIDSVYAKSNAVKEQIRHRNGKISNKKGGKKQMSK